MPQIVSITSKGQATIPKEMREKFGMKDKVIALETEEGILFKPLPSPSRERGSLKNILGDKTVKELLEDARRHEKGE